MKLILSLKATMITLIFGVMIVCAHAGSLDDFSHQYRFDNASDVNGTASLTASGSVSYSTGRVGNAANLGSSNTNTALYYDSNGGVISYSQFATNWTISGWMNSYNFATQGNPISLQVQSGSNARRNFLLYIPTTGVPSLNVFDGSSNNYPSNATITAGAWYHFVISYDGSRFNMWINNTLVLNQSRALSSYADSQTGGLGIGNQRYNSLWASQWYSGLVDSVIVYNRQLNSTEREALYNSGVGLEYPFNFSVPVISNVVCTSCNVPYGDNSSPYSVTDSTPTFNFTTSTYANCRFGSQNQDYATMNSSRDCTTGQGTLTHTCTLPAFDAITQGSSYVYAVCANILSSNATNTTGFALDTSAIGTVALQYILYGIQESVIGSSAVIYQNQQVYLRAINNSQLLATVDVVAAYGNQRWLFNYANESESLLGLFNLSPAVYVLEFKNASLISIRSQVTSYINSTKN